MILQFVFSETSPAAAGTAASKNAVQSAASYLPAGVAGPVDDSFGIQITCVAAAPVGGALNVYIQTSPNDGLTWFDQVNFAFTSGVAATQVATLSAISQPASAAPVTVGGGLAPLLANSTVVQGMGFNRIRLVMVAGSGTSAGTSVTVYVVPQRNGTRA